MSGSARWIQAILLLSFGLLMLKAFITRESLPRLDFGLVGDGAMQNLPYEWYNPDGLLRLDRASFFSSHYDTPVAALPSTSRCDLIYAVNGSEICQGQLLMLKAINDFVNTRVQTNLSDTQKALLAKYRNRFGDLLGRRILILGDSVDRNDLSYLSMRVAENQATCKSYTLLDPDIELPAQPDVHLSKSCVFDFAIDGQTATSFPRKYKEGSPVPPERLRLDALFTYGMVEEADWWADKVPQSMVKPFELSKRLELAAALWGGDQRDTFAKRRGSARPGVAYDLIVINWGLWELAAYQKRNYLRKSSDSFEGLDDDFVVSYSRNMATYVSQIRQLYGHSIPIMLRVLHNTRRESGRWFAPTDSGARKILPFSPLRTHQFQRLQCRVASELGLVIHPFALHMKGQDEDWLGDDDGQNYRLSLLELSWLNFSTVHPAQSAAFIYLEMLLRWFTTSAEMHVRRVGSLRWTR